MSGYPHPQLLLLVHNLWHSTSSVLLAIHKSRLTTHTMLCHAARPKENWNSKEHKIDILTLSVIEWHLFVDVSYLFGSQNILLGFIVLGIYVALATYIITFIIFRLVRKGQNE